MELLINDQPIDFQLTDEINAAEIRQGLKEWGENGSNILATFTVNGREYFDEDDAALAGIPVSDIKKIEAQLLSPRSYAMHTLAGIEDYLLSMENELVGNSDGDIESALKGFEWVRTAFGKSRDILGIAEDTAALENSFKELEIILFALKEDTGSAEKTESLKELLSRISKEMHSIYYKGNIATMQKSVSDISPETASIAVTDGLVLTELCSHLLLRSAERLQSGDDASAMSMIRDLTEAYSLLVHLVQRLISLMELDENRIRAGDKSFEEFSASYAALLKQIEECFTARDYVRLSDLLEYELDEYTPVFKGILESLRGLG